MNKLFILHSISNDQSNHFCLGLSQGLRQRRQPRSPGNEDGMALALGKLNFSCAVIGLTFINRTCRQKTGTPKFKGSGCQFPQSQCHPSPRTGIALGTRLCECVIEWCYPRKLCACCRKTGHQSVKPSKSVHHENFRFKMVFCITKIPTSTSYNIVPMKSWRI
jgi:hypothetical protein